MSAASLTVCVLIMKSGSWECDRIEEGIEGRLVAAIFVLEFHPLEFGLPNVVIGLARRARACAVELSLHPRDAGAAGLEPLELAGVADVVEPVLALLDAEPGRELGPELQILREFGVEESGEARVFGIGGSGGRGRPG